MAIDAPLRTRRRGAELKLPLGEAPSEIDRALVRNIVKAKRWMEMIIQDETFTEITDAPPVYEAEVGNGRTSSSQGDDLAAAVKVLEWVAFFPRMDATKPP